jgi:type IV secretory pathway VirB2 component (pilin)
MPEKTSIASSVPYRWARGAPVVATLALTIAVTATLLLLATLLRRSHLGFDFTDEGYYLNSIANPWRFSVSPSQFGYFYHPLYQLLGGDVAALRQSNILISFCLAVLTCLCLLRSIGRETSTTWHSAASVGTSIVAASSALLIVIFIGAYWLPTPSYNSLAFQSLLIASIGLCLAEAKPSRVSVAGWVLIGIGGSLAFMAKPTSAAALGVVTLGSLAIAGKLNWRMLAISVLTCILLMSALAWVIDGSIVKFVQDLLQSTADPRLLFGDDRADIFRFDPLNVETDDLRILAGLTALMVLLAWLICSERRGLSIAGAVAVVACAAVSLALVLGVRSPDVPSTKYQGLQFLAAIFAALLSVALLWRRKSGSPVSRQGLSPALFFAALPLVYAFGSNVDYWLASQSAALFWTLSAIALMASARSGTDMWRRLSPFAVVTLAMTAVFVHRGMMTPHRQTRPLTADADVIQVAASGARLLVSRDFAEYINASLRLSRDAGFKAGTPMIDLTGHYPGMLYIMAAKPVGAPWLIGGYPGSDELAAKFLGRVSCEELAESWILTEPDGLRKLSPNLLKQHGTDIQRDYAVVAVLDSPTGTYPDSYKQQLLKPMRTRQASVSACESARARKG